jgi:hypothetical protein
LPLTGNYELLKKIGNPVGTVWAKQKSKVLNILEKRNYNFLSHGMNSIGKRDFQVMLEETCSFSEACDIAIVNKRGLKGALQLPRKI